MVLGLPASKQRKKRDDRIAEFHSRNHTLDCNNLTWLQAKKISTQQQHGSKSETNNSVKFFERAKEDMNNHNFAGIVVCYHGAFNVLPKRRLDRQTTSHHIIHTACYYLHCLFLLRNTNPSPRREEWKKERKKHRTRSICLYFRYLLSLIRFSPAFAPATLPS